jgi:hypothetical protein
VSASIIAKVAENDGLPWVDALELYALAGREAELMVTDHLMQRMYISAGGLAFRMNAVQWLIYERMCLAALREGLGPESDPLAGAGVLPEGPLGAGVSAGQGGRGPGPHRWLGEICL